MTVKDKKDIRPLIVKLGVALAISFAGFLYSRLTTRRTNSLRPLCSPRSSDDGSEADVGGQRARHRDDFGLTNKTTSSGSITSISAERYEDSYELKVAVDNSMVVSPSSRHSGDRDGYLLPEFNNLVKKFDFPTTNTGISPKKNVETPRSDAEMPAYHSVEKDNNEHEMRHLKNLVRTLRERERKLEVQLLEFYGVKEQEAAMMELQNRLKINNMETKFLGLKIESMQADNLRLQEQVADHAKIVAELDAAGAKIKWLRKKLRTEAEQNKEQILFLHKRVSDLQEQELKAAATDSDIKVKLQRLKALETEAEELRKSNLKLQVENSELASKLESTQILANSILEDPETEALRELGNRLKQENEDLEKELEQLQADRYSNTEELVYLRWINACLRYELRNFQPPHGKTIARDLSKCLSPNSEQKAKQLILEYANTEGIEEKEINIMDFEFEQWSSSQASQTTDSGNFDDSSSSPKTNNSSKIKILNKLMRLMRGKEIHHHNHGSSSNKTGGVEDSDSANGRSSISTVTDTASDLQSSRFQTPSLNSSRVSSLSRHSFDIQMMRSLKINDVKDVKSGQGHGSAGSHGYTRFSLGRESASDMSLETLLDEDLSSMEKSRLVKFAEVLKDSGSRTETGGRTGKVDRKSVTLGSFEALQRSASK